MNVYTTQAIFLTPGVQTPSLIVSPILEKKASSGPGEPLLLEFPNSERQDIPGLALTTNWITLQIVGIGQVFISVNESGVDTKFEISTFVNGILVLTIDPDGVNYDEVSITLGKFSSEGMYVYYTVSALEDPDYQPTSSSSVTIAGPFPLQVDIADYTSIVPVDVEIVAPLPLPVSGGGGGNVTIDNWDGWVIATNASYVRSGTVGPGITRIVGEDP